MKILFLDSIEVGVYGGMEEWIRLVALGLAKRGHEVVVVGRPKSAFIERLTEFAGQLTLVVKNLSGDFNPLAIASLRRLIRRHGIDLVCVNFNRDVRLGGLAAKVGGDVSVVWSVGLDISVDNFVHRRLTPRLIDGVIVPSEALKKQITSKGYLSPESVRVIPIGIEGTGDEVNREEGRIRLAKEFGIGADDFVCATVGRFVEQKGHIHLVAAAREIIRVLPSVRFLWFGDGPLENHLQNQIASAGLTENFIFAGMRTDVTEFLPGSDLMIHPSIEEPFGIAVLEGMRAGLPIVASRVGGIPEVVKEDETAVLVSHADPKKLSEAVISLVGDPDRLSRLGAAGRDRWQQHFSLDGMIDTLEHYFTHIRRSEQVHG